MEGKKKHLFENRVDEANLAAEEAEAATAIQNWFGKVQEPPASVSDAEG